MANELWQSDAGAKILIDHLQDGIYVIENGKFVFLNQRLADMLEYSIDELIGHAFIDLIQERDQSLVLERYRARLAGEEVPNLYNVHLMTKKGRIITCALNVGMRLNQNGQLSVIGSVRDISDQEFEMA